MKFEHKKYKFFSIVLSKIEYLWLVVRGCTVLTLEVCTEDTNKDNNLHTICKVQLLIVWSKFTSHDIS